MRKSMTSFALAGLLFIGASASAVLAQTNAPAPPNAQPPGMAGPHEHPMQPMDPAKQLAHLTAKLNLSAEQQAQIKPILVDRDQQAMALHTDTTLAPQDKRAKMESLHAESDAKIEAVLNDQQKKQYAEMKQKHQEMMHEHMKHHMDGMGPDAPPPPPPPAQ
jgi:protein CpxP